MRKLIRPFEFILMMALSNLSLFCPTGLALESKKAVMLRLPKQESKGELGLLSRELVRQAFLIAARDEMGLPTRDAVLREDQRDSQSAGGPFEISIDEIEEQKIVAKIWKSAKNPALLKEFDWKIPRDQERIESLTAKLEALSRNDFVAVLTKAKCEPRKILPPSDTRLPEQVEELLKKWNAFSQFAAVRQLHAAMRNFGESPELLAGLSRGYAQLGCFTQFLWSPIHQAFKARALLYAERLQVKYPGYLALMTRAYVRALIGLHQNALNDLEAARNVQPKVKSGKQTTDEDEILHAYCHGESGQLAKYIDEGKHNALASYLNFLSVEPTNDYELRMRAVETFAKYAPDSLQAADALMDNAPLGIRNTVSRSAPQALVKVLSVEISEIADLPEKIQKLVSVPLEDIASQGELMQALWAAGRAGNDVEEPSLTLAGNLIQEIGFIHAWRRMDLELNGYGWNSSDTLETNRQVIKGHPYVSFLEYSNADRKSRDKQFQKLLTVSLEDPNLELIATRMSQAIANLRQDFTVREKMIARADRTYREQLFLTHIEFHDPLPQLAARRLLQISPFLPATIEANILYDWDTVAVQVPDWEKTYDSEPLIQQALGRHYFDRKPEAAEYWLKRRVESMPDHYSYRLLADYYKSQDDDDKWVETLIASLELENFGLDEAQIRVKLAKHFMAANEPQKGIEQADLAAETEASWALICAMECHEQIGDFTTAEQFVRRNTEHYNNKVPWYFWCRRTGRGDVNEARALAEPAIKELEGNNNAYSKNQAALFYFAEGNKERALELLQDVMALDTNEPTPIVQAAFIADELRNTDLRDTLLSKALQLARASSFPVATLLHDFQNALRPENPVPFDAKINAWRASFATPSGAAHWNSWIGQFLVLRGRPDDAVHFLQTASTAIGYTEQTCTYAGIVLARLKVQRDPLQIRPPRDPKIQFRDAVSNAFSALRSRDVENVQRNIDIAAKLDPNSPELLFIRSLFEGNSRKFNEAIEAMSRCLEQQPQSTDALMWRGRWYEYLHAYPDAIRDYEKVIEIDPYHGSAYLSLSSILGTSEVQAVRDGKRALELAQRGNELDSDIPEFYRKTYIATALAELKDFAAAIEILKEVLESAPPESQPAIKTAIDALRKKTPIRRSSN